jgi:hypothetical protein
MFAYFDLETFAWTLWFMCVFGLGALTLFASWPTKSDEEFLVELTRSPHAWDEM